MRKLSFYIFLALYLCGPLLYFIAKISSDYSLGIGWLEHNIKSYKTIQDVFLTLVFGVGSIVFSLAFYKDGIFKYQLSDISGVIGIVLSLLSLCLMLFWSIFIWLFAFSGVLCLYASLVPLINEIYKKMDGNNWEKSAVTAVLSLVVLFFINFKSNILLNDIFSVDPKHFPYTKMIAGLVVVSPYLFLISFFSLLFLVFKLITFKKDGGSHSFIVLNGMLASVMVFAFSFILEVGGDVAIKNAASTLDFNSKSICLNVSEGTGVIFMDDKYDLILLDKKKKSEHIYQLARCNKDV